MRKKNLAPKIHLLVLTTMISLMLFGCGNSQAESAPATAANEQEPAVAEETNSLEETYANQEEQDVNENTSNEEEAYEAPVSSMIDWEIFAAQENTEDICLAISNETTSVQSVLYEGGFYAYREGDRIAIPIRENISRIGYYAADENGKQKDDVQYIYWKGDVQAKYIEFEVGNDAAYYLSIFDDTDKKVTYMISTIAEVD